MCIAACVAQSILALTTASHATMSHQGGRLVSGIEMDSAGNVAALISRDVTSGEEERHDADAVVFAISIAGTAVAVRDGTARRGATLHGGVPRQTCKQGAER